jgi:hypothetical protein
MKRINPHTRSLIILGFCVATLCSYNFILATGANIPGWTPAPANPPQDNAALPLNDSSTYQYKEGDIGVVSIRAGYFCTADGLTCATLEDLLKDRRGGGDGVATSYSYTNLFNQQNVAGYSCSCAAGDTITSCSGGTLSSNSCTGVSAVPSCTCQTTVPSTPTRTCEVEFVTSAPEKYPGTFPPNISRTYTATVSGEATDSIAVLTGLGTFKGDNGTEYTSRSAAAKTRISTVMSATRILRSVSWMEHEATSGGSNDYGVAQFGYADVNRYAASKVGYDAIDRFDISYQDYQKGILTLVPAATIRVSNETLYSSWDKHGAGKYWINATVKSCTE